MIDPNPVAADPSVIGGIAQAPFALRPDPDRLFARRADRFAALAPGHAMTSYLVFLEALSRCQAAVAVRLPPAVPLDAGRRAQARAGAMPPVDRAALADAPDLTAALDAMFDAARAIAMPAAACDALAVAEAADPATRAAMAGNVLADAIPFDSLGPHLFVAAGVQVAAARLAATLDPTDLTPVAVGVCPACGGPPVASLVVGFQGAEGTRYAVCTCCATAWNEVRVKCLACGSTKGIGYRDMEGGNREATIKAEVCDECGAWVKILYQDKSPALDAVADDVASLGLDLLVRDAGFRRAGFNPFLIGY